MNYMDFDEEIKIRFTAWLRTLVKRARIDYLRENRSRVLEIPLFELSNNRNLSYEIRMIPIKQNIDKSEYEFEREDISRAFAFLSNTRRRVFLLLYIEGMSQKEVAKKLGISVQRVSKIKQDALFALKEMLED